MPHAGAGVIALHASGASLRQVATRAVHRAAKGLAGGASNVNAAPTAAHEPPATYTAVDAFELPVSAAGPGGERIWVVVVERGRRQPVSRQELEEQFGLTPRESEVALAMADRMSSPEIASALGISRNTARRHCERVLTKLALRSRREIRALVYPDDATA